MSALILTLLVLSYEFVYKEQVEATGSGSQARTAVLYACIVPYAVGVIVMLYAYVFPQFIPNGLNFIH